MALVVRGSAMLIPVLAAATGLVVANVVAMLQLALLGGRRNMVQVSVAQVASAGVYAGLVWLLLVAGKPSVAGVTAAAFASTAVLALGSVARSTAARTQICAADLAAARRLGLPAMAGEIASLLANRLDLAVIAILLTSADVGRYAVALSVAELLWIVPNGASQVLLPQVAHDDRGNATAPLVVLTTLVGLVAALVLAVAGRTVIPVLFGSSFDGASAALPWLCLGAVLLGASRLLLADLAARGHTMPRVSTALAGTAVMVAGDIVLVPAWGIAGGAVASAAGGAVALVLVVRAWVATSGSVPGALIDVPAAWRLATSSARRLRRSAAVAAPLPALEKAPCLDGQMMGNRGLPGDGDTADSDGVTYCVAGNRRPQ
jgi:O-antigen/teichoic acid export membrane protein